MIAPPRGAAPPAVLPRERHSSPILRAKRFDAGPRIREGGGYSMIRCRIVAHVHRFLELLEGALSGPRYRPKLTRRWAPFICIRAGEKAALQ